MPDVAVPVLGSAGAGSVPHPQALTSPQSEEKLADDCSRASLTNRNNLLWSTLEIKKDVLLLAGLSTSCSRTTGAKAAPILLPREGREGGSMKGAGKGRVLD